MNGCGNGCGSLPGSSKDGLLKLWDLHTQHCFQTLVSHHREVWSFEIVGGVSAGEGVASNHSGARLITSSGDTGFKVFQLSLEGSDESEAKVNISNMNKDALFTVYAYRFLLLPLK